MICKFCGNTIEDNSDFCFICGQKVAEEETAAAPAENMQVFSQVTLPEEEAQAETVTIPVPEQSAAIPEFPQGAPIYAQAAPIYAQQAPVYAQQAIVQQMPAAPQKQKKNKDKSIATKATKFFSALFAATFVLQFISWIWYKNAVKQSYDNKAVAILNSTMVGLCIFMAIVCFAIIGKYML